MTSRKGIATMEKTNYIAPMGANPAFRDLIYDLMNGHIDSDKEAIPESQFVGNECAEGKRCERLYVKAYQLKQHLFIRLHSEDDEELEQLINCLCEIERIMSRKMFDYGWFFAKQDTAKKEMSEPLPSQTVNK